MIVDEVHERSVENDFLLLTLRRLLLRKPDSELSVCLMSATLDGEVLSSYFDSASPNVAIPRVSFPGRTRGRRAPRYKSWEMWLSKRVSGVER